jgi:hypothetical protein
MRLLFAGLTGRSAVFRTEPRLKPAGSLFILCEEPSRECKRYQDHNTGNNDS